MTLMLPKVDVAFKLLFGDERSKNILADFLKAVRPELAEEERLPAEGEGKLLDWLRFLKAETEEEFKMLSEKSPLINEAYCKLQVMSEDEANRMLYEARLKAQRDEQSRIQGALNKGWEQGREEIARKALAKGLPLDVIGEITGLDQDAIKQLSVQ